MWTADANTARTCAEKFDRLMKERPTAWSDNFLESIKELTNPDEQLRFLAWCSDPMNKTGARDRIIKESKNIDSKECFENHPDFEVRDVIQGKNPTYHITYKPNGTTECVDEKTGE